MPERAGGVDRKDIDDGFRALASVRGAGDIGRLIDTIPVLRTPIFHANLRQYRYTNEAEFKGLPEAYERFMEVYDEFFTHLHFLANYDQSQAEPEPGSPGAKPRKQVAPPFFESVQSALGSTVPSPEGPAFHPQSGIADITATIERLAKKQVALPAWEATPGTLWSCVVVACGRCQDLRLAIVPYLIDIYEKPKVLDSLRSGVNEWSPCPRCSAHTVLPLRIWIAEDPSPRDPLGAICTLCRVRETEIIFRPPPGTARRADDDRILEVRLEMLIRQLGIEQPTTDGVVLSNGIAYSPEELLWRIDHTMSEPKSQIDYEAILSAIYQKLLSGLLNWQDAERQIRRIVTVSGQDWPMEVATPSGDSMKALLVNLVAEACAEFQEKPVEVRVALAELVSQCFARIGETARARSALARARDLAENLPEDPATQAALAETEADILRAEGRYEEAARIRPKRLAAEGEDASSRLKRAEFLHNQGLELRSAGRLREAIETLESGLSILRALVAEDDTDDVRHTLSGTLADLALVYSDCAQNLEALAALAVRPFYYKTLPIEIKQRLKGLRSPDALLAMQREMLGPVSELLKSKFGGEPDAASLRARAIAFYREAISEARDLEYLCIQSCALAALLKKVGDMEGAEDSARKCIACAIRLRNYKYIAIGTRQLAGIAGARGDAPAALESLSKCMEASIREAVRGGAPDGAALAVAGEALHAAVVGADPLTAVLIAESAKAISTSISLIRAAPLQGEIPAPMKDLLQQLEALRLRSIWEPSGEVQRQIDAVQSAIAVARRELVVRDPRIGSWHDATDLDISRPAPFRRLLERLGRETTYVGFTINQSTLFTYAVWPADQILECVDLPVRAFADKDPNALASLLLLPLASRLDRLAPDDRLIISPCPELQTVPFALLPFQGKPLCTRATISLVSGSGMFEACASRPMLAVGEAVALGAPARPDVPELRGAAAEVEDIAARLESAAIRVRPELTGAAATVPALAARVHDADLIHFACHAALGAGEQDVRLLLAPAPLVKDSGVLSEQRILSDLRLKPGCHVNLAACRSAVSRGEGEYHARGLVTAFLVAGASSVLAALWPLADEPAADFQGAYYERIARGQSPAVALAGAQRAAIDGDLGEELRLAQNFGGYVLYGLAARHHAAADSV